VSAHAVLCKMAVDVISVQYLLITNIGKFI